MELDKKTYYQLPDKIRSILLTMNYNKKKRNVLKGSASLSNLKYYGDFDLFQSIEDRNPRKILNFIKSRLKKIDKDIFLELKIQYKNGEKEKYYSIQDFLKINENQFIKKFNEIEFIKIDFIIYFDYKFLEVSQIYQLDNHIFSSSEYIEKLKEDIKEYTKDGNFMKVLKRKFSIFKIDEKKEELEELTKIFNSDLGKDYQTLSILETIKKIIKLNPDKNLIKKINNSLKTLSIEPNINTIDKHIKELKKSINIEAKKYNSKFKI